MTDETQITLNSKTVAPIMVDILNGTKAHEMAEKHGLDPAESEQDALLMAVAYISVAAIYTDAAGKETADLVEASEMFASVFCDAQDKARARAESDD